MQPQRKDCRLIERDIVLTIVSKLAMKHNICCSWDMWDNYVHMKKSKIVVTNRFVSEFVLLAQGSY